MVITTTAIGFISLGIGLTICGAWFLHAFKKAGGSKSDSKIGLLIGALFMAMAIQNGVMGIGTYLFARDPEKLFLVLLANHFFLIVAALLGIYTSYYIFSPKKSTAIPTTLTVLLGFTTLVLTIINHPRPFMTLESGIDLNMGPLLSLTVFILLLTSIGSTVYIFGRLFFNSQTKEIKRLSLILALCGVLGVSNVFVRLIIFYKANTALRTGVFDLILGILGLTFVICLFIIPFLKKGFSYKTIL